MTARIIPYQVQTRASGGISAPDVPLDRSAGGLAGAAAGLLSTAADVTGQIVDREGRAEAAATFSQAEIDEQNTFNTQSGQRVANPDGFGKEYLTGLDERNQARLSSASGPARQYLTQMLPNLRTSFGKQSADWEFGARKTKTVADTMTAYDNTMASVYSGTISRDEGLGRANALVNSYEQSGFATPESVAKMRMSANRDADWYSLMHNIKQDPTAYTAALKGTTSMQWDTVQGTMPQANDALVNAVIGQESGGKADAESVAGASGVMQIMPNTARDLDPALKDMSDADVKAKLKADPVYNKKLGTQYLNQMLTKYNGDTVLALAAYNAGPTRTDASLAKVNPKTEGYDKFIATLPAETQAYIPSVLGKMGAKSSAPQLQGVSALSADDLMKAGNIAETQMRSNAADHRASLEMDVSNDLAQYADGETVSNPKTYDDFKAAYPTGDDALKRFQEYQAAADTGSSIAKMKGMTNTQIAETVQGMQPTDTADPNYANKRKGWLQASVAGGQILQQRAADPGTYVRKNVPSVQQAWIDYGNDPSKLATAVKTTLAAQDMIGIPTAQQNALPKDVRAGMIDQVRNAPPQQAWQDLHSLGQSLGDNWSQVFSSLSTGDGALSRDYQTLALIDDPTVGAALASAYKLNKEQGSTGAQNYAEAQLGKPVAQEIPAQVTQGGQFSDYLKSIAFQGGDTLVNQQADAATQAVYMLAPQVGVNDAIARVSQAMTGKYDIVNRGMQMIARAPAGTGKDMAAVADWYQNQAPASEFRMPGGDPSGGYKDENLRRDLQEMRSGGLWVTSPRDDGWILRGSAGQIMQHPDGTPIEIKFDDLAKYKARMKTEGNAPGPSFIPSTPNIMMPPGVGSPF